MSRRLKEEDIENMVQMYKDGVSVVNIAGDYNCTAGTVYRHISSFGITNSVRVFTFEEKQSAVSDWLSGRYTLNQVAKAHNIGVSTLEKWTRLYKKGELEERERRGYSGNSRLRKVTPDTLSNMRSMYLGGDGIRCIGQSLHLSPSIVKVHLLKMGIYEGGERVTEREDNRGRKDKFAEKEKMSIVNDYTQGKLSVSKLCEKYSASKPTVIKILKTYGTLDSNLENKRVSKDGTNYSTADVIADYDTGLFSHGDLAKAYKVSTRTISRILDSAGVEANPVMRTVSANEVAKVLKDVKADLDTGMSVYDIAKKYSIPMYTVEKIDKGSFDNLRVTRSGETVKNYYTPVKKEPVINKPETPEDNPLEQKVVELHSQGLIVKEIAEKAETSVYHVKRILEKLHLEPNSPSDKRRGAVIAFCKQGMSVDMIAEKAELSAPTVRKILQEEGLSVSKGNEEVKAKVLELHQQGLKAPKIALECGISAPTVRKIISEAQVTTEQKSAENETVQSVEHLEKNGSCDIDVKIAELYDEGMEVEEIAQELGLSRPMVMFSLRKAMDSMKVHRPFFTDFEITEIKSLAHQWVAPDAISNKLKCHENYVRRFLDLPDKSNVK